MSGEKERTLPKTEAGCISETFLSGYQTGRCQAPSHYNTNTSLPQHVSSVLNLNTCGKFGTARQPTEDNTIRRMRIERCITKATDTHSEYAILLTFVQQQRLSERATMLRLHLHCLYCQATK